MVAGTLDESKHGALRHLSGWRIPLYMKLAGILAVILFLLIRFTDR